MTIVTRLRLLTAVLGVSAATAVVATTVFGDSQSNKSAKSATAIANKGESVLDEFARSKFATQPTLVYKAKDGPAVFAWQVKPTALVAAVRPRDIVVMVDTSASQAGEPLKKARQVITALTQSGNAADRVDIWSVNLDHAEGTRSLTRGFKAINSDDVTNAAAALTETEVASGATDLKAGLEKVLGVFERNPARQQVILFLGDGESSASKTPLDETARVDLGSRLDQADVAFFAVPLGLKINSHNLHGFASLTGGAVVRLTDDINTERGRGNLGAKLKASFDVPVLKPNQVNYGAAIGDVFPTRLPPLRGDRPVLVVGTLKADAPALTAKIDGTVAGQPISINLSDAITASDTENYFIHAVHEQWKTAVAKDEPAILSSDRALALAAQQFRLFREDYLTQAVYAVSGDKIDQAEKLYQAVLKIDPTSSEAEAGLRVVAKVRKGEIAPGKLKGSTSNEQARAKIANLSQDEPKPAGGGAAPAPGGAATTNVNPADTLKQAAAERAVQEQQFRVLVDETIRRARALLTTDPDSAYEDLKRNRDVVLSNSQLGDAYRLKLAADLEAQMQTIATKGAEIKRRAAEERERIARTSLRINEGARQTAAEEATRSQIDAFRTLMSQARFELAQQEAQVMIQDRISRGQPVPPEAVASYMIGQAATNYREYRELVRIREDRYLLTMMQSEKSFIPYPDEPPVHFPPAAVWRELTSQRAQNAAGTLGGNMTKSQRNIQNILNNQRIRIESSLEGVMLDDFLKDIQKSVDGPLSFVILEEEFKAAGEANVREKKLNLKQSLYGLTISSALDIALQNIQLTYVVRPEYIEICSYDKRLKEKVVQTFDVGELVYDIPSSVNQAVLNQNQNVQAQNLQLFGQSTFAGGLGGAVGGQGFGGQQNNFGGGGGGIQGNLAQGAGVLGGNGIANNLGAGGGVAGIGGGQIGQFGNLGGQFGIQGNSLQNYQLIANLVMEVVARGEWASLGRQFNVTQIPGQNNNIGAEPIPTILPEDQLNSLAYYPPSRAMVVRGTGKYHPQTSIKLKKTDGAVQGGAGNPARGDVAAATPGVGNPAVPPAPGVGGGAPAAGGVPAAASTKVAAAMNSPSEDAAQQIKQIDRRQPNKMWQQAMDLTKASDPGLVLAAADFLVEHGEFHHAAEVLKTGIRLGLTTDQWAQDALAMALKNSPGGGQTFEGERAAMSAIDLEPASAKSYIRAARAADDAGRTEVALAYCHRAADLDANLPAAYSNALVYAEKSTDVKSDAITWASNNLLQREWANDGVNYHAETRSRLNKIATKYDTAGLKEQGDAIRKSLDLEAQRDLVIELLWQGEADLDLSVTEPTGSTANATHKRTVGGGILKADILEQANDRSETYTAAQAFSGTYTIAAKQSFKTAVGDKAQVKVTKFKGTDRESVEFHTFHFNDPKPIDISMTGGTRTDMVLLTDSEPATLTLSDPPSQRGMSGGTGSTGATSIVNNAKPLPTVMKTFEEKLPAFAPNAPTLRAEANITADRKQYRITMSPIVGTDVPMPKVSLLPGGRQ